MAGISRYEAAALGLTAAFVFFTAGWFFASRTASDPYTVTVQHSQSTAVLLRGADTDRGEQPARKPSGGGAHPGEHGRRV